MNLSTSEKLQQLMKQQQQQPQLSTLQPLNMDLITQSTAAQPTLSSSSSSVVSSPMSQQQQQQLQQGTIAAASPSVQTTAQQYGNQAYYHPSMPNLATMQQQQHHQLNSTFPVAMNNLEMASANVYGGGGGVVAARNDMKSMQSWNIDDSSMMMLKENGDVGAQFAKVDRPDVQYVNWNDEIIKKAMDYDELLEFRRAWEEMTLVDKFDSLNEIYCAINSNQGSNYVIQIICAEYAKHYQHLLDKDANNNLWLISAITMCLHQSDNDVVKFCSNKPTKEIKIGPSSNITRKLKEYVKETTTTTTTKNQATVVASSMMVEKFVEFVPKKLEHPIFKLNIIIAKPKLLKIGQYNALFVPACLAPLVSSVNEANININQTNKALETKKGFMGYFKIPVLVEITPRTVDKFVYHRMHGLENGFCKGVIALTEHNIPDSQNVFGTKKNMLSLSIDKSQVNRSDAEKLQDVCLVLLTNVQIIFHANRTLTLKSFADYRLYLSHEVANVDDKIIQRMNECTEKVSKENGSLQTLITYMLELEENERAREETRRKPKLRHGVLLTENGPIPRSGFDVVDGDDEEEAEEEEDSSTTAATMTTTIDESDNATMKRRKIVE